MGESLDTIFLCSQPGPDWQAAREKFRQNGLRTRRNQTARRMMKMGLNPLMVSHAYFKLQIELCLLTVFSS